MPFSSLAKDNVDLIKADGAKITGLKASVQSDKIYMAAGSTLVEPGDVVQRHMSNGASEMYRVVDPCFYEQHGGIPANYQMKVVKLGLPEAARAAQNITYHIHGNNARVNQNSVDNSTNTVHVDNRVVEHIVKLRKAVDALDIPLSEKATYHEVVDEVNEQFKSGAPKRPVVKALLDSLPHVANVTAIASAIAGLF